MRPYNGQLTCTLDDYRQDILWDILYPSEKADLKIKTDGQGE